MTDREVVLVEDLHREARSLAASDAMLEERFASLTAAIDREEIAHAEAACRSNEFSEVKYSDCAGYIKTSDLRSLLRLPKSTDAVEYMIDTHNSEIERKRDAKD